MELITLTTKETRRLELLTQVAGGSLSQAQAASLLCLSVRQIKRLLQRYRRSGPQGLASRRRGRVPNNRIQAAVLERVLELHRTSYAGFGPTFTAEKLLEREGITLSKETVRQILIRAKLWQPKRRKKVLHLPRPRRAQFGELIQTDGSPHDWFEGRGPRCTLLLMIDDATGAVGSGRFEPAETTDGYFALFERYFQRYGLPIAIYSDRHEIFRINQSTANNDLKSQVGRALHELGVELICANSPQAKGRIERLNRTCQDRLIKDMRLHGISSIEAGNTFLPQWIEDHNRRFAIAAANPEDAHRLVDDDRLPLVLCRQYERVLSKLRTVQFERATYFIEATDGRSLCPGMRIAIHTLRDGTVTASHPLRKLTIRLVQTYQHQPHTVSSKELNEHLDRRAKIVRQPYIPPKNHPWRPHNLPRALPQRGHF